jgi:pimeloyl-ACP methyl ester carboxylesterase
MPSFSNSAGITIEYDTFGSRADPALLFVMGFTAQMTAWPEAFMQRFADAGRFVIRFDNRDCGLSGKLDGQIMDMAALTAALIAGDVDAAKAVAPYLLSDMARDAVSVLDHLGIQRAHIAGASMGGMIVQTMAIEHPDRILTMTSIMSTTGNREFGKADPAAMAALVTPAPSDREGYINASTQAAIWASKKHVDLNAMKERAAAAYDRSYYPEGVARQMAAIIASGSREDGLAALTTPTLVIHGLDDKLIGPTGGQRTAEVVPGAHLLMVSDMGHDLPEPLWPLLVAAIVGHNGLHLQ